MVRHYTGAAILPLAAAGLLLVGAGCQTVEKYSLTYRVWNNADWRKFSEPAPNPHLALFESTNRADVLVEYDALSEKRSTLKRQAYYLEENEGRIAAGKKPKLVPPSVAGGMQAIPVLPTPVAATNLPPARASYSVLTKEGRAFTLYRSAAPEGKFDLPVYAETSGTATRLVLTPFAVAGDTVMVGAVAGLAGFFLWVQSGAPTH